MREKLEKLAVKSTNIKENKTMRKYLALIVALTVGTTFTVNAVILDPYKEIEHTYTDDDGKEVTETGASFPKDDGEGWYTTVASDDSLTEKRAFPETDTSSFSTWQEYKDLINNELHTDKHTRPYRVLDRAHPGGSYSVMQSVLDEAIEREIADENDIFADQMDLMIAASNNGYIGKIMPEAYQNINNLVNVSDIDSEEGGGELSEVAVKCRQYDDTNESFENIWTVIENNVDMSEPIQKFRKAERYHIPRGEESDAYNIFMGLAEANAEGLLDNILAQMINNIQATEELLWECVYPINTEFLKGANIDRMLTIWNEQIKWWEYENQEVVDICDKYLMAIPTNEDTAPFISAVKEKKDRASE